MRPTHIRLVAVAGVLAVAIGVATAFVVARDDTAQPAAAPTPTTIAAIEPADTNDRTDPAPTPTTRPPVRDEQAAKATAVAFLRELGMRDPVAATYRGTGAATAEVGLHPKAGEGGRLFEKVTTLVQLHRYTNGWVPTGAKAADIEVAQPLPFARVLSPLTVSGQSVSYEGTVHVTVTQDRRGPDRVLGKGFVNGGGTELAPFLGTVRFASPTPSIDAGWVVFSGDTGADTGIIEATAVRVRFVTSDHRPQILGVSTNPPASGSARLVTITGSGTLGVTVKAFGADEVRVLLVPSGTDARSHAKLLGVDTTAGADGESWSVSWRYPDQSFHGHLLIQVNGRGGTAEHDGVAVLHT
ncbi:MAG TPA: Gmad2 immunoglobulin-like domain-containing protein [Actinomycetes bacterium]|nr:Gmad2 immunoglobulin-like domain-containing protein [Actinomycetes bacterium]